MNQLKYFSMFSGIGGFEKGIEQAYESMDNRRITSAPELELIRHKSNDNSSNGNGRRTNPLCIGFSEIDKYAIQIYQKHYPKHKNYGSATEIIASELPDFDLLVGGFPCQSFSIAGKRGGFDDTRGTLFFDIARILKEKRPRNFVLENVKGLLSHDNGRTFKTIITTLVELGYCVEWQVINSKNFGVPQNRERVYIVGHLGGEPERKVFPIGRAAGEDIQPVNSARHDYDRIYSPDGIAPTINTGQRGNAQPKVRIAESTKKGYAEATIGQSINLSVPNSKTRRGRVSNVAQTLDTGMQQYTMVIPVLTPDRPEKRQNGRRFKEDGDPSFTLTAQDRHGITDGVRIRRLTLTECERLQGFPDGWTDIVSDTQRYKCCGNAVTVNVVQAVMEKLIQTNDIQLFLF